MARISTHPMGSELGEMFNIAELLSRVLRSELPWRAIFLPHKHFARMVDRVNCLCTFRNGGQRVGV